MVLCQRTQRRHRPRMPSRPTPVKKRERTGGMAVMIRVVMVVLLKDDAEQRWSRMLLFACHLSCLSVLTERLQDDKHAPQIISQCKLAARDKAIRQQHVSLKKTQALALASAPDEHSFSWLSAYEAARAEPAG
ncbi:unnamed protein product [Arctogadus glacialis]